MIGLGFLPDTPDPRDFRLGAAAPVGRPPGDLRPHIREILDQGPTNHCVVHAIASAKAMHNVARGRPWELFSRSFAYRNAVLALGELGVDDDGQLLDLGCRARDALKALTRVGAPPEHLWGFEPTRFREKPPFEIRRQAVDLGLRYEACSTVEDIRTALALGRPVVVGFQVDRAFLNSRGPDVIEDFDQADLVGGHMGTLVRDLPELDQLEFLNSYGRGWRDGGLVRISARAVQKRMSSAWAVS